MPVRDARLDQMLGRGAAAMCAAFDQMEDAVGVLWPVADDSGSVVDFEVGYVNSAGDLMMGFSMDKEFGSRLLEVMPAIAESGIFTRLVGVATTGEPDTQEIEWAGLWRGAVQMSGYYIHSLLPFGEGVLSLAHDITETRRRETELRDFAAVAAHDLRDPLVGVNLMIDVLVRKVDRLDDEEREMVDLVRTGIRRSLDWVDGTLDYARAGADVGAGQDVDCAGVLDEVVEALGPQITQAGATVMVGSMPVIQGHREGLTHVFQNLIANSLKFHSDAPPVVDVSSEERPDGWEFAVSDNGVGIGEATGLFEMFSRGNGSSERPGTGIGLAVCRRVVERHNGRIWAVADADGGSTFSFWVPA